MLNHLQSYKAMFYFLENYYFATKNDTLGGMLGFMSTELFSGDAPVDSAVLNDWEASIKKVTNNCALDIEQIRQSSIEFLKFYHTQFGYNINCVIKKLEAISIHDSEWSDCVDKAKRQCSM